MKRYRVAAEAKRDLKSIYAYISQDRPRAAINLSRQLRQTFSIIGKQPLIGELRPDLGPKYRGFAARGYLIVYQAHQDLIEIVRVIHGARDVGAIFPHE